MMDGRTSSYVIYVDLPDDGERMVLVHGYSGCYDLVPRRVARFLRAHESRAVPRPLYGAWQDDAPEAPVEPLSEATMATLWRRGYLTRLGPEEERKRFIELVKTCHRAESKVPSFVIVPTYSCNLRCFYCFQDSMRSDPEREAGLRSMPLEKVDEIFASIARIEATLGVAPTPEQPRRMGLFGGEPLLSENRGVLEHIISRARADGPAKIWAISNATELDGCKDLLGGDGIGRVQVTLDGPPDVHDRRRVYGDGSPSFERVAKGIDIILERGAQAEVRVNVDRKNIVGLPTLAAEFASRGWLTSRNFRAYAAPVHAGSASAQRRENFTTWELDVALDALRQEHPEVRSINRPDDRLRTVVTTLLGATATVPLKASYCGANNGMYVFDASGEVYACVERAGDARYSLGKLAGGGDVEWNAAHRDVWRERSTATLAACQQCRYGFYCGGGCTALAENMRGTLSTNYCDGYSRRFRAMVAETFLARKDPARAAHAPA